MIEQQLRPAVCEQRQTNLRRIIVQIRNNCIESVQIKTWRYFEEGDPIFDNWSDTNIEYTESAGEPPKPEHTTRWRHLARTETIVTFEFVHPGADGWEKAMSNDLAHYHPCESKQSIL